MVGFGHFEYGFPGVSIYFQIPAALDIENHCVMQLPKPASLQLPKPLSLQLLKRQRKCDFWKLF